MIKILYVLIYFKTAPSVSFYRRCISRWDYYKPFDGMSEVEVQELSSADVDHLKSETMEKNAWTVSNEIRLRIDDTRDPSGGYLKAYVG
jgi:hypothetical protein